jgi:twinkle protein
MLSVTGKYSGHEKIEEILRRITHFSHQMGVMILLVAHPFKMKKDEKTGDYEIPDFYSVKGSSAFFEMSYHGFTVYRSGETVLVRILKVKQNNMGAAHSDVQFQYDRPSGRYIPIDEEGNVIPGGNSLSQDWLEKALELMKK